MDMSVHGTTRDVRAPVRLELTSANLVRVETQFDLTLADFGIVVIMPRLLSVDDHVHVKLSVLLGDRSAAN
jgi:hypothetical protein